MLDAFPVFVGEGGFGEESFVDGEAVGVPAFLGHEGGFAFGDEVASVGAFVADAAVVPEDGVGVLSLEAVDDRHVDADH